MTARGRTDVLVVEDNPLSQKLLTRFLAGNGFRVLAAGTTAEAEALLEDGPAALILLDVSLPGEDGLTFLRRLRSREGFETPVVAVTAHAMAGDCDRALDAGCAGYLTKPVDLHVLLELVRSLGLKGALP